jgi:hypothetical protein
VQPAARKPMKMRDVMLVDSSKKSIVSAEKIEALETRMLSMPQVDCPVVHHFAPGICIREVTLPTGAFAIGHHQKFDHMNMMLKGSVLMLNEDGTTHVMTAPMMYVSGPGRKIGLVINDVVWQNIYATDLRDVDAIESHFLDKSQTYIGHQEAKQKLEYISRQADRNDFEYLLSSYGFNKEQVRSQAESEDDQIEFPFNSAAKFYVKKSSVEGVGAFLSSPAEAGEIIAPARISGLRTPAGRYVNHSMLPNAKFVLNNDGDIYLVATRYINGSKGGDGGEEVTVDYRQALSLSGIKKLEEVSL